MINFKEVIKKTTIITLCGSTKFKPDFEKYNKLFTLQGCIVLAPGVFGHSGDTITEKQKKELDLLHKRKIAISDVVFIIDKNSYIGKSTREEIEFAKTLNIPVFYLSEMEE